MWLQIKNMAKNNGLITAIDNHIVLYKNWLNQNWTPRQIAEGAIDEAGYPNWKEIEDTFEKVFKELNFKELSRKDLESITYLIAQQWDIAIILFWFDRETNIISQLGMTEEQLLVLAEFGLSAQEWSARQQYAASLMKVKKQRTKAIDLAIKYHQDTEADVRRFALTSLLEMDYPQLTDLVLTSWQKNDEDEQMLCLLIWEQIDKKQFDKYLQVAKKDTRPYMRAYVQEMKGNS